MKPIVNSAKRASAVFVLCATTAAVLPAQTFTTLFSGDTANCHLPYGCGTAFEITPSGALTALHTFAGCPTDGEVSFAGWSRTLMGPLRDNVGRRGQWRWHGFQPVRRLGTVRGNPDHLWQGGSYRQDSGKRSDRRDQRQLQRHGGYVHRSIEVLNHDDRSTGATSGTVRVVTPSGTLSSNVPFRVLP
jgi:hypothetical protein